MHSWEIVKWQNNVAEDIEDEKLERDENLLNGLLEVSFQIAKLREDAPRIAKEVIKVMNQSIATTTLTTPSCNYEIRLFGFKIFTIRRVW